MKSVIGGSVAVGTGVRVGRAVGVDVAGTLVAVDETGTVGSETAAGVHDAKIRMTMLRSMFLYILISLKC